MQDDEHARHRPGEGGAFPSLFTPFNLKYHRRAFAAILELDIFNKNSDQNLSSPTRNITREIFKAILKSNEGLLPLRETAAIMKLTDNVLRSFRVAKVFRENSDKINCFDFSSNGETIISSSDDDSLVLYDCQEGK